MNTRVIDTNIIISALIRDGLTRKILTNLKMNFIFPEYGLKEIYYYKKEIMRKSGLSEKGFDILLLRLLKYVRLIPLSLITDFRKEAEDIIGHIHKNDVVFIATALAFNCPVWSDDKHFKMQNRIKVLTTEEIKEILNERAN